MSGRRVLGCRNWENPEMGYWKQPGPTCLLTQPHPYPTLALYSGLYFLGVRE